MQELIPSLYEYIKLNLTQRNEKSALYKLEDNELKIQNNDNKLIYTFKNNQVNYTKVLEFVTPEQINDLNFLTKERIKQIINKDITLVYVCELNEVEREQHLKNVNFELVDEEAYLKEKIKKVIILDEQILVRTYLNQEIIAQNLDKFFATAVNLNLNKFWEINEFTRFFIQDYFLNIGTNKFLNDANSLIEYKEFKKSLQEYIKPGSKLIVEKNEFGWISCMTIEDNFDLFENIEGIYTSSNGYYIKKIIQRNKQLFKANMLLIDYEVANVEKSEHFFKLDYIKTLNGLMGDYFRPVDFRMEKIEIQDLSKTKIEQIKLDILKLDLVNRLWACATKLKIPNKVAQTQISLFAQHDLENTTYATTRYIQIRESFRLIANELKSIQPNLKGIYKYNLDLLTLEQDVFIKTNLTQLDALSSLQIKINEDFVKENTDVEILNFPKHCLDASIGYELELNNIISIDNVENQFHAFIKQIKETNLDVETALFKDQEFLKTLQNLAFEQIRTEKQLQTLGLINLVEKYQNYFATKLLLNHTPNFIDITKKQREVLCIMLAIFEKTYYYYGK